MSGTEETPRKEWSLAGGGETGELMRTIDWSRNALGPAEKWPQSLRTVLSILMTSKQPISIWWGRELIQLYNDAYRPILGGMHPLAMGRSGRDIRTKNRTENRTENRVENRVEIRDAFAPMIEAAMDRGESTCAEDGMVALNRNGFLEECFFTYGFSPIRDEGGGVGGVFATCSETTRRVLGERRLRVLHELDELGALGGPGVLAGPGEGMSGVCRHAMEILASDRRDIPFALIYLFDDGGESARLEGTMGVEPGGPLSPQVVEWNAREAAEQEAGGTGGRWPLDELAATGRRIEIRLTGFAGFPQSVPAGPWPEPAGSALAVPLVPWGKPGSTRPMGALIAGLSPRLAVDGEYLRFLELAAGRIAATLANADEYAQARRRAEAAEREARKFLALVEQSSDFVGLADLDGGLRYINEAGRRMIGIHSTYVPADFRNMAAPDESKTADNILSLARETGRWEGEVRLRNAISGKIIPVWCNFFLLKDQADGNGASLAIVTRDLSQLRETEEHLRHAQKMEAIGLLAGGIAHDFNNLLTAINGYGDLALGMVPAGTLHDYLREIRNGGERAATLTRQLLAYSRKQILQPKKLNLNDIVREIQKILLRLIGAHIELEMRLAPDLGLVTADPGQMEQILLNLSLNARDAMPEGGKLVIETYSMAVDSKFAATHLDSASGEYAVLAVTDTGVGMSKDVLAKAFEPFFTTKDVGKGTGLGLSSVYGIIKQSGGSILADSEPGRGSSFRIFLPLLKTGPGQGGGAPAAGRVAAGPDSGGDLILLVEDESTVLVFVKRVLEQKGFRVLAAKSAEEALEIAKEHQGAIDLLLTDMVMPGMNGRRLAERFAPANPQTRILYMSGYIGDDGHLGDLVDSGENFIQKPFTASQLLERIRALLGTGVGR